MDVYSWFRRIKTYLPSSTKSQDQNSPSSASSASQQEETIYGITSPLIEFVKTFTLETFRNFHLPDEEETDHSDRHTGGRSVREDLSDWQERHATLVLTEVKELSQLRFRLCPRYMNERKFWRIYFALVKSYVAEYELHAVRLEKLRQMKRDNETSSNISGYEVEMSEAKQPYTVDSVDPYDHKLDGH